MAVARAVIAAIMIAFAVIALLSVLLTEVVKQRQVKFLTPYTVYHPVLIPQCTCRAITWSAVTFEVSAVVTANSDKKYPTSETGVEQGVDGLL